jgi:serine/threonine protein kinase
MPFPPGTLLGCYKIRSALGAGGMGEVFLAEDTELERLVAFKVLPGEVSQHAERIRRFVQKLSRSATAVRLD